MLKRITVILLLHVVGWLAFEWIRFPDVAALADEPPKTTAFMEQRKKQLRNEGKSDALEWQWVAYGRISPSLRRAVLVSEDNAFYEHEGVDTKALKEAFERNWKRGKITHGGSTITQQLAKNLYLSPSRNPLRKVREYFIARSLEKQLSKKRILEIYLNVVELGERVYGAEAAARHYFGKSAAALTAREAALLAGALPNPRVMNPGSPNRRLRARQKIILSRLERWGYLLEREVLTSKQPEKKKTEEELSGVPSTPSVTDTDFTPDTDTATQDLERPSEAPPTETVPVDTAPPPATDTNTTTTQTTSETSPPPPTNT